MPWKTRECGNSFKRVLSTRGAHCLLCRSASTRLDQYEDTIDKLEVAVGEAHKVSLVNSAGIVMLTVA
jgi:hypothetical protein